MNWSNIFRKPNTKQPNSYETIDKYEVVIQNENNLLVEQIHRDFSDYTKNIIGTYTEEHSLMSNEKILEKAKRMQELGFSQSEEVIEAHQVKNKELNFLLENSKIQEYRKAYEYFYVRYPEYKLINEDGVQNLCKKYTLFCGDVNFYQGNVPDKNLQEIEKFVNRYNHLSEDDVYQYVSYIDNREIRHEIEIHGRYNYTFGNRFTIMKKIEELLEFNNRCTNKYNFLAFKNPFKIVAPQHDFARAYYYNESDYRYNPNDKQFLNFLKYSDKPEGSIFYTDKHELYAERYGSRSYDKYLLINYGNPNPIKDPIILKPVLFKEKRYYLVITAWGAEAKDNDVFNEKLN